MLFLSKHEDLPANMGCRGGCSAMICLMSALTLDWFKGNASSEDIFWWRTPFVDPPEKPATPIAMTADIGNSPAQMAIQPFTGIWTPWRFCMWGYFMRTLGIFFRAIYDIWAPSYRGFTTNLWSCQSDKYILMTGFWDTLLTNWQTYHWIGFWKTHRKR